MQQEVKKKKGWRRVGRIVLKTFMWIFLLIVALFLLILTPPVQNFITKKATNYLEKKLKTKVEIGRLFITLAGKIAVDDIYVEDRQKDTLLSVGELRVNMSFYKILFGNELDIKSIRLDEGTARIKRTLPDTVFNFQFIVDAFGSGSKDSVQVTDTSASMAINIDKVELNKLRLVYQDVVTGNDIETSIGHFDTKITKFDLDKLHFIIPRTNLSDLTARIIQVKPLVVIPDSVIQNVKLENAGAPSPVLQMDLQNISLKNIALDYRDSVGALYASTQIGNLELRPKKIDLSNADFDLGDIVLGNTKAVVRMDKTGVAATKKIAKEDAAPDSSAGIKLRFSSLGLNDIAIRFDNDNDPIQKTGMDYSHIDANISTLQVQHFLFSTDSVKGVIAKANLKEKSGFELQELRTDFLYASDQAYLRDLYLKTPGTELKRNVAISYPSIEALKKDIGSLQLNLDLDNSKILVRDILTFVPSLQAQPAMADPNATWYINSDIKGRVADMQINTLQISGLSGTRVDMSGRLSGLPDINKFNADLSIREISSSRRDISMFVPAKSLPKNITLPGRLTISGKIKGNSKDLLTDVSLRTDLGNAHVKGSFQQITDSLHARYDAIVETRSLDLGTLLQDKENLGPVTANIKLKGTGFSPRTANATMNGKIQSAVFRKYTYRDLTLNGSIAKQQVTVDAGIVDPNIHFALNAAADLSKEFPSVKLNAMIDSIKTFPLHLTPNSIVYRGKIEADFPVTDPGGPEGKLIVSQSLLIQDGKRIDLDTLQLIAGRNNSGHFMHLNTDIVNAQLQGKYKLTELGQVFQQAIDPYFATGASDSTATKAPYDFTLNAEVINGPLLQSLVPSLTRIDSVTLQSRFSDSSGWFVDLRAPAVEIGTNRINGLDVKMGTSEGKDSIDVKAFVKQVKSGSSIQLDNTTLTASLANDKIDFDLNIQGDEKDKYNVGGIFSQPREGEYAFALKPRGLILNYDPWSISPENKILVGETSVNATNFVLSQGNQQLSINSQTQATNAPLEVGFNNFRISTLTGFVQNDSTLVDGLLNGKAVVNNVMTDPVFTSDLTIKDLSVQKDTVGDVKVLVNNQAANTFNADVTLSGRENDVRLNGNYFTNTSSFDMNLDIRKLPLKTAQAFSGGSMRDATGYVDGRFSVKGSMDKPSVNGALNFNKAGFNLSMLNNYLTIDQEKIQVDDQGIRFNKFEVKDSANNALTIDGTAATTNFSNYKFDLDIRSANFRALNSTKKDNKLFYGQLYFNSNLKLSGTEKAPSIDGRFKVNEKTKLTVVLPQKEPGVVDREGVVEFVDMDAPLNDSLFMAAYDSMNTTTSFAGMDISVNVEIDKAADLTLIVDEGNGDFLNVKGEALLNVTVNPAGDIIMAGTYELEEGAYALSFNGIKRRFDIQKGSKITWGGEPTAADVNISAKYVANTAPLDLVKGQLGEDVGAAERNTYLQKLPFEVMLKMEGKLLQPQISFDIILPDNKSYVVSNDIITTVRTKLDQLRQEEGELNKQVFALLLLNRFVAENPFNSSGSISATTLARQSVSKLMTEQLNKLASDLVQGVDLSFDVQSSDDYTTGERRDRTDLNVGLSKSLLNDRLTVSVGSNFELEGPQSSSNQASNIAGNVALNYRLSKDGRYQLRAYRKNEYQGVIDGYVIETGVGFIITIDYNKFREIFQQKKIQKERQKRQEQRKKEEQQNSTQTQKQPANP